MIKSKLWYNAKKWNTTQYDRIGLDCYKRNNDDDHNDNDSDDD